MRQLNELLADVSVKQIVGPQNPEIHQMTYDSRLADKQVLFFAIKGSSVDGHIYIDDVIRKGASCIVCTDLPSELYPQVTYVHVNDTHEAMAQMASAFYHHPSRALTLVAVTGTNGKTTVATLLFKLFRSFGHACGLLSTVQNQINESIIPATHTTPDAIALNSILRQMVDAGVEYAFMEASSHAIDQRRIGGLQFRGALFTNITHDHLDYHKTFDHYLKTKKRLFDDLPATAFALTNKDDRNGQVMLQNCKAARFTYSLNSMADFKARIIESDITGMLLDIDQMEVWFRLVGKFNAYNLLAVYGAAFLLGKTREEVVQHLSMLDAVKGRFECVRSSNQVTGIVDYAHTPDALENILSTINSVRKGNEQVITVIGCGGNRDKEKRPVMAEIAASNSDRVLFTSDNPRNEDPEQILNEMMAGLAPRHMRKVMRITDRREAIRAACQLAQPNDIILLAGKGHENYQEIQGIKHPFDDKQILSEMLAIMNA